MHKDTFILLVDDDLILRTQMAKAFKRRGFTPLTASCYEEAMEVTEATVPDYAVLDLKMPGESGIETLKSLRQKFPELRAIILTGYGSISTTVEAMRTGAVNYLPKPADVDEIITALTQSREAELPPDTSTPSLARVEWEHIHRVLNDCDGNISETARRLGMHRRSLQRKLQKYPPAL